MHLNTRKLILSNTENERHKETERVREIETYREEVSKREREATYNFETNLGDRLFSVFAFLHVF